MTSPKGPLISIGPPAPPRALYCEIDGLPVEVDPGAIDSAGLFVETPQPAAIDSEVELFLRIGEQRFVARGQVVKVVSCASAKQLGKRPGYAVLFTSFEHGARERERLSAAISTLAAPTARARRISLRAPPSSVTPASAPASSARPRAAVSGPPAATRASASPGQRASHNPVRRSSQDPGAAVNPVRRSSQEPGAAVNPVRRSSQEPGAAVNPVRRSSQDPGVAAAVSSQRAPEPAVSAEERALLARLTDELAGVGAKTPWAMLGISQGATPEQLRAAFFDASKRYHPHLYARYAHPDIKRLVTELFIAHKRAYTHMLKAGKGQRPHRP